MEKNIPLYLITGFLGSGKTSVINNLLSQFKDKKVGLILNDFGSITVDAQLVQGASEVVLTKSLNGGQIFCSCLSGSFIKSVLEMSKYNLDIIIVEASGLAKPVSLLEIVSIIADQTHNKVTYSGMICVVDAERYLLLSQSLKTLEEQIVFSDWFIVNKSDLASEAILKSTLANIKSLKPLAQIFTTSFGKVTNEMMKQFDEQNIYIPVTLKDPSPYSGWGLFGRPKNCLFVPQRPYEIAQIREFFDTVAPYMLRMKGFIPYKEETNLLVDVVGKHVKIGIIEKRVSIEIGVVCLYSPQIEAVPLLREKWAHIGKTSSICTEHP